jgi:hypothetical protein
LKDLQEKLGVPAGAFSPGFDAPGFFVGADETESEAANGGHVFGAVASAIA